MEEQMIPDKPLGACGILCSHCAAYKATQAIAPEELKALAAVESR